MKLTKHNFMNVVYAMKRCYFIGVVYENETVKFQINNRMSVLPVLFMT